MYKKTCQRGAGLLETMIALFVLAVGLLGFAALLTNSLTMNQRAFTLSQAMMLANNYVERMRVNRSVVSDYAIAISDDAPGTSTNCLTTDCTDIQMVEWDKSQWFSLLSATLPSSDAEVIVSSVGDEFTVDIEIQYELRVGRVGDGNNAAVEQMQNIVDRLTRYNLSTEL